MIVRMGLCLFLVLGAVGCGMSQARLDEARARLQDSLEVWKKGGKPTELVSQAQPVEFYEQMWNSGEKLLDYEIARVTYQDRDKVFRCEVRLTVRTRKGKTKTENLIYDVYQGTPTKIVNNPMP